MTDKATLAEIRDRLFEAAQTLRRLPDPERGYLRSGERAAWPPIILTYWEAYGMHSARVRLPAPPASQITRMEEALGWLTWLGRTKGEPMMRCVWICCAKGLAPSQCGSILGLHRNTVRERRDSGLAAIAKQFSLKAAA